MFFDNDNEIPSISTYDLPVDWIDPPYRNFDSVGDYGFVTPDPLSKESYDVRTDLYTSLGIGGTYPMPGTSDDAEWPSDAANNSLEHYAELNFGEDTQNTDPGGNYVDCYIYSGPVTGPLEELHKD
jgi:hypothetical protein